MDLLLKMEAVPASEKHCCNCIFDYRKSSKKDEPISSYNFVTN
jgi:hypothetical protein